MHHPPSDETETAFRPNWQPESGFPTQPFPEGVYDALVLAQSLVHIAVSSSSLPTPEGLNMAVAAFQAAMKLHWQSPPVYEPNDRDDIEKLHDRLELIEQELKVAREETARAVITLSGKLDDIAKGFEAQAHSTAQAIEEETRKCSTVFEGLSSGIESIDQEVKSLMVVVDAAELEATTEVEVENKRSELNFGREHDERGPRIDIRSVTHRSTANEAMANTQDAAHVDEITNHAAHEQNIQSATSVQTPSSPNSVPKAETSDNVPGGGSQGSSKAQEADEDETSMKRCSKCKGRE
ncbi:hypothetical protein FS837_003832 [Tulasnella sp. UAMH 9824]|nr:hypothetical protein FS837_003832 [Tulasnella sp. UAMH 9824]